MARQSSSPSRITQPWGYIFAAPLIFFIIQQMWISIQSTAEGARGLFIGMKPFWLPWIGEIPAEVAMAGALVVGTAYMVSINIIHGKQLNALAIVATMAIFSTVLGFTSNTIKVRKEEAKKSPIYEKTVELSESKEEYAGKIEKYNRITDGQNARGEALNLLKTAEAAADSIVPEPFEIDAELANLATGSRKNFKESTTIRGAYNGFMVDGSIYVMLWILWVYLIPIAPEPKAGLLTTLIAGIVTMSQNLIDGGLQSGNSITKAISEFFQGIFAIVETLGTIVKAIAFYIRDLVTGKKKANKSSFADWRKRIFSESSSPTSPGEGAKKNSDSGNSGDDRAARGRDTQRMKKAEKVRLANEWRGEKSQEEIAAKLGVDARTVRRYWNEKPVRSRDEGTPKFGRN